MILCLDLVFDEKNSFKVIKCLFWGFVRAISKEIFLDCFFNFCYLLTQTHKNNKLKSHSEKKKKKKKSTLELQILNNHNK